MKKTIILFVLLMFAIKPETSFSQITEKVYAGPEELKKMKTRPLMVALMDVNTAQIEKWKSKGDKYKDRIVKYENFISTYNNLIQKVVKEHWNINSAIEFKPMKEVQALNDKKDSKYVFLVYNQLTDMEWDVSTFGMSVPILQYHRSEISFKKRDYFAYLPYMDGKSSYNEADIIFAVKQLQKAIDYTISTNKEGNILDYYLAMAKANCAGKLKTKEVICDNGLKNPKTDDADIAKNYSGKFKFVETAEIEKAVKEKSKDAYVTCFFPFGIAKGQLGASMLLCCKVIFDPATDEIIYYFEPGGMGSITDNTIRPADLKRIEKCDFK